MGAPFPIPALRGELVTLRAHRLADLDAVLERCVDPDTRRYTTIPLDYTREMATEYLTSIIQPSEAQISWAIEVDGRYAGTIDLRAMPVDGGAGNLGFVTHPAFRGRGVMTEAVRLVVAHGLETLGWQLIRWQAHAGNVASAKAMWRNGFPVPTFVPYLLLERGRLVDGWMSTLHTGASRQASLPWEDWLGAISGPVRGPA